jgi:hypothetical protein
LREHRLHSYENNWRREGNSRWLRRTDQPVRKSLEIADAIVVLQPKALEELHPDFARQGARNLPVS